MGESKTEIGNAAAFGLASEGDLVRLANERLERPCQTPEELHAWLQFFLGIDVPTQACCPEHDAPFEYMKAAYFEPAEDLVVWAPRQGGKTRLAAALTLLDLLHKKGTQVRILGGSLDQSLLMWEHLREDVERAAKDKLDPNVRDKQVIKLTNGSKAAVLAQSQKAVRGLRVQKLRCDEVEMFDKKVWDAAQLVTRSMKSQSAIPIRDFDRGAAQDTVRGTVEGISTFHKPWGVMSKVIENAREKNIRVLKWCMFEVMERCPQWRKCDECDLEPYCHGVAKTRCNGFVAIDDVLINQRRVSRETFETEVLCRRPNVSGAVFPHFDPKRHVKNDPWGKGPGEMRLAVDFGFRNPFVCLWVCCYADNVVHVIDEYVQSGRVMHEHVEAMRAREWTRPHDQILSCDPAGAGANDQTAESNVAYLKRCGYRVRTKHSRIAEGIEMIRFALCPAAGDTKLFVHHRCTKLIRALQGYHYPEKGGELPEKDGEHDHLIDALRYHYVNREGSRVKGGRMY